MSIEADLELRRGGFVLQAVLSVPSSGVTAVLGPSGSGKTSLLRALAGLERGVTGRLRVGDRIWQDRRRFVPPHRRSVGYVFQEPSLFAHLSVRSNLSYGLKRIPAGERRVGMEQVVDLLDLGPLLGRRPGSLSGGERQRVAIGRALLASPRLLLMDEPLSSLDVRSKAGILPFLEALHRELSTPVIYVSHAPEEVARLADRVALMEQGRVRMSGPVAEMFTRLDLPLAHGDAAEAVVQARIAAVEAGHGLSRLEFAGGGLLVPQTGLPPGAVVRLRIPAREVSLALEAPARTSILNIIPVRVADLRAEDAARVMVRLEAGGVSLLSRVTRKSVAELGLAPGREVFAQIKSVAVLT